MISASVCLSSQPDTAVQPAKEFCSYTTCWDTITIEIRRARQDDAAGIQALLLQLGYEHCEDDVRCNLALLLERTSDPVLVASEGDRLLGMIALHWTPMLHLREMLARITALVVREDARGRGVGRRLVDTAAALARSAGCDQIELTTALRRIRSPGILQRNRIHGIVRQICASTVVAARSSRIPSSFHVAHEVRLGP